MFNALREDELHHQWMSRNYTPGAVRLIKRVLQPVPLGDFVVLALMSGSSIRGLQSKITKFLGGQVRHRPSGEIDFEP